MPNKKCFMQVTNEDIYHEIVATRELVSNMKGRIKLNTWISSTALSLCVGCLIGLIVSR